jgi:TRAP-type C4-dicarboxylate transport system substrate-binding protein
VKNVKKLFICCICLLLLITATTLVAACAEPAPAPAPAPPAPTPAPPPTSTTLAAASYLPPGNPIEVMLSTWGADLQEKTGGRYTVEVVSGGALATLPECYDAVVGGVADIAVIAPPMIEKPFPLTELPVLFWGPTTSELMSKAWMKNVYEAGYLDEEWQDIKVMMSFIGPVGDIETVEPINTIADMEGLKLANAQGPICVEFAKRLGAVSVLAGPPDIYLMLQKGIADGMFGSAPMIMEFNLNEFVNYMLPIQVSHMSHIIGMNQDTYAKMPDDVKKIVDEMCADEEYSLIDPRGWDDWYNQGVQFLIDGGGEKIEWSEADIAKLNEIAGALWEEEMVRLEGEGYPAREVCDALYKGMEELGATPEEIALGYRPAH